ncbi:rhomboid family intramembrane serine protease [Oricola cellulosilytica]|uniref:Rhomboid family intramembrane serine protease n=1 Tax=Oricola cellulosilytica TaxID=1429082 RepID=A0A4R0PGK5_9HYPH|nr:rhomboid family intramembrane serine protease [Oricola cellulosilytica]TCD14584.1 rhomboid family intramembrane serine protease [Oricola cellulosilytica]
MNTQPDHSSPQGPAKGGNVPPARAPAFNLHGSIVLLSVLCIAVHLVRTSLLSEAADTRLLVATAFFPIRYMPGMFTLDLPTIFSPFTYAFLHGDWVHLAINLIWLAIFGSPLAFRIGWARSVLFWLVTAALAAATHLAIYFGDAVPVLGASGAVSGFMGAAARYGLRANRAHPRRGFDGPLLSVRQTFAQRGVVPFLLVWIFMNVAIGADLFGLAGGRGIAWEAHIGGLIAGFLLVPFFDPAVRRSRGTPFLH